jgi:hypothetical protein
MNPFFRLSSLLVIILTVLLAACAPRAAEPASNSPDSPGSPVTDYASLVTALQAAGATVEPAGEIEQAFFPVKAQVIKVDGNDVQVFEFADEAAAADAAALVSREGSAIGTNMVTWMASPHFYRSGTLIVLYVGEDEASLSTLASVLGEQFAGG